MFTVHPSQHVDGDPVGNWLCAPLLRSIVIAFLPQLTEFPTQ